MNTDTIYGELGISAPVLSFCREIEESLKERFARIDETAE